MPSALALEQKQNLPYLDWRNRPARLQKKIDQAWLNISDFGKGNWFYNGNFSSDYGLASLNSYSFLKNLIQNNPQRKEFYVLDIGAGNFCYGRSLAKFLNKNLGLRRDIKVHVVSIRGEKNEDEPIREDGLCKIYELGCFKVENLLEEFAKLNLFFDKKMDLVISSWCFRHLVDPVGTLLQAYSLSRPVTGLLLMNGFFLATDDQDIVKESEQPYIKNLFDLFIAAEVPILVHPTNEKALLDYVIRRPSHRELELPLKYCGLYILDNGDDFQNYSGCITHFKWLKTPQFAWNKSNFKDNTRFCGNKELYQILENSSGLMPISPLCPRNYQYTGELLNDTEYLDKLKSKSVSALNSLGSTLLTEHGLWRRYETHEIMKWKEFLAQKEKEGKEKQNRKLLPP